MVEVSSEVQEVIDYVLKYESEINFKVCTECRRNLPVHDYFFGNHPLGKYGKEPKCKECKSRNNTYKFEDNLKELYYKEIKDEFINKFRYMANEQLERYFNLTQNELSMLIRKYKLKKSDIINTLTEEEIIFMYESLLKKEIQVFTNGMYNNDKYIIILIKYMINNILKWNRDDICKNLSTKTLKNNGLRGLLGIKSFHLYEYLTKSFPEYNIMPWELKSSTVGNGFWTEENIEKSLDWLRLKLYNDKNINNINIAGTYGFSNLLNEYNFNGLCNVGFSGSPVLLFEKMYGEYFSKEEMLKDYYTFEIDTNCVPKVLEGKIYKLIDLYYDLDDRGKTLVNEVIKFCEVENKFPNEKDLNNGSGYICRTQYYKYFGENTLKQIYNYILPIYDFSNEINVDKFRNFIDGQNYNAIFIKPNRIKCIECGEIKEFNEDNFSRVETQKFGLKYTCRVCDNKYTSRNNYKHKGVIFNDFEDFLPEQWWEFVQDGKIRYLPEFCLKEENAKRIIRYVLLDKLDLTRDEIKIVNKDFLKVYNIFHLYSIFFKTRLNFFNECFPELEIKDFELDRLPYDDELINTIINNWIKDDNISILDILNGEVDYRNNSKIYNMLMNTFISKYDMFIWYFKKNGIKHPNTNKTICIEDFDRMPFNYWNIQNNRIKYVKRYCEENGIINCLNDTNMLKDWVFNYFRQEVLDNQIRGFDMSYYETLIEAYPSIKNDNILFEWEWHQYKKNDNDSLIKMLKQLVIYRMNDIIIDIKKDTPKYLNQVYINEICPKFNKQLDKKRFNSYYEWACLSFPEYKDYWTPQMFDDNVAYDGTKCDSKQEMLTYEFIKKDMNLTYLKHIGRKKSGEHTFKLSDEYDYERFCPDFVLEYIDYNDIKIKLDKPLYIEYYGWYAPAHNGLIFINYYKKVQIKNKFYKNNNDIEFIDLYPDDLKNNLQGVRDKLTIVLKEKYNLFLNNSGNNQFLLCKCF